MLGLLEDRESFSEPTLDDELLHLVTFTRILEAQLEDLLEFFDFSTPFARS